MIRALAAAALLLPLLQSCKRETAEASPARDEKLRPVLPDCPKCGHRAGELHLCGRTRWCDTCSADAAEDHLCGKTRYCPRCRCEAGGSHVCGETRICWSPRCRARGEIVERGPNHVCGKTFYCAVCRRDAIRKTETSVHHCNLGTYACPRCEVEVTADHVCGRSRFCPSCMRAASLPAPCRAHEPDVDPSCSRCRKPHQCGKTAWCSVCGSEKPLQHSH